MDNSIDNVIQDSEEKHRCREALDASTNGVLIEHDGNGRWCVHPYGASTGDLSYAVTLLQHTIFGALRDEDEGR